MPVRYRCCMLLLPHACALRTRGDRASPCALPVAAPPQTHLRHPPRGSSVPCRTLLQQLVPQASPLPPPPLHSSSRLQSRPSSGVPSVAPKPQRAPAALSAPRRRAPRKVPLPDRCAAARRLTIAPVHLTAASTFDCRSASSRRDCAPLACQAGAVGRGRSAARLCRKPQERIVAAPPARRTRPISLRAVLECQRGTMGTLCELRPGGGAAQSGGSQSGGATGAERRGALHHVSDPLSLQGDGAPALRRQNIDCGAPHHSAPPQRPSSSRVLARTRSRAGSHLHAACSHVTVPMRHSCVTDA